MEGRQFKDAIYGQFARIGSAFASPKRIEIVDVLAQGERTVESLAGATSMSVANTSRHLQVLRQSGLVLSRRDGLFTFYRVADESVVDGFRAVRSLAESRIGDVAQLARAFFGDVDGVEPLELDELMARSRSGDVVVVDVRPRLEFLAAHIPGAINIPLEEISSRSGELSSTTTVVAYCRGPYCVMSADAVSRLRAAGVRAQRLAGGPLEWGARGLSLATGDDTFDARVTASIS